MLTSNHSLNSIDKPVRGVTDTRPTLAKFRRQGLYIILRANGHDVSESTPHTEMLAYAMAHEKTLSLDGLVVTAEEYGGFKVAKPREIIEEEKEIDNKIQTKREKTTEKFTKKDGLDWDALRAEARELGINIERMKEEEIIAAIVDARKDTSSASYDTMPWNDLKSAAKERGIEIYGKKKEAILKELKGD